MNPSSFDEALIELRDSVRRQLRVEADRIVAQEIERILGRVKIIRTDDLTGEYWWSIQMKDKNEA